MMKLYFMKSKALDTLKQNLPAVYGRYFTDNTNHWMYDLCDEDPFEDTGMEVDDFRLASLGTGKNAGTIDLENCKIIYRNLMQLNETQASDERLWAGLTNGTFYSYMRARWGYDHRSPGKVESDVNEIKTRFFFRGNKRSGFYRNTLSKCWWVGKALYDPTQSDPFRKLDILGPSDLVSKITAIFYSNAFSSNPTIVDGIIQAIDYYNRKEVKLVEKTHIRPAMGILNAIGGRVILDCLTSDEIKNLMIDAIEEIITGKNVMKFDDGGGEEKEEPENKSEASDGRVSPAHVKAQEGDAVVLRSLDGQKTKTFQIKKFGGKIPDISKSLIGKAVDDEVEVNGSTYTIISVQLI